MEQIQQFARKRGNQMSHGILYAVLTVYGGFSFTNVDLAPASKGYVEDEVQAVRADVEDNKGKLDRILELQIVDQLEKLLRFKCMNPGDTTIDVTLRDLERDYRELTGAPYQRPSCDYLLSAK